VGALTEEGKRKKIRGTVNDKKKFHVNRDKNIEGKRPEYGKPRCRTTKQAPRVAEKATGRKKRESKYTLQAAIPGNPWGDKAAYVFPKDTPQQLKTKSDG